MTKKRIYLSSPHMGENELKYVKEAFDSNWIAPVGPNIDLFEQAIASYSGVPYAAALSSGTAAIHLALIILGVRPGDEVICSSFTFAGSCNPIVYQGATPVFVDSEPGTWNMDPQWLERAITDRVKKGAKPKAIILVHLYGMPAKIEELISIARRYEIPVVEDAAEALGSEYKGRKLGSFGDFGVYSFNGNKIITTSGGGALVSYNKEYVQKAKFLSTQARDDAPHYEHSQIGYNYRMSNICAGIGRGQMEVLDERVKQRRKVFDFYVNTLKDYPGVSFLQEIQDVFSNRWLTTILIDRQLAGIDRETIRIELEKYNIESRPLWKPMHMQSVFRSVPFYGERICDELFDKGLCLPSGSNIEHADLERTMEKLKGLFEEVTKI